MYRSSVVEPGCPEPVHIRRGMIRVTFARRSRVYPGLWLPPEVAVLPAVGARKFIRDANASPDWHIISARRCKQ